MPVTVIESYSLIDI